MDKILKNLCRRFDHAALNPEVDERTVKQVCREAQKYNFCTVAVNPVWVKLAADELRGSEVRVLSVAGFPLSANRTDVKLFEAIRAVKDGASEIDMVANVGWLVSDRFNDVTTEIREMRDNLPYNVVLKVIIEAGKLNSQQQTEATRRTIEGGAQFVKTCTGFFGGATVDQVRVLHKAAGGRIEVKASGGIRTLKQCRDLLEAGATRLGSSASVDIMNELAAMT